MLRRRCHLERGFAWSVARFVRTYLVAKDAFHRVFGFSFTRRDFGYDLGLALDDDRLADRQGLFEPARILHGPIESIGSIGRQLDLKGSSGGLTGCIGMKTGGDLNIHDDGRGFGVEVHSVGKRFFPVRCTAVR